MKRTLTLLLALTLTALAAPVAASDTAPRQELDPSGWAIKSTIETFETAIDPHTGEQFRVPVVTTVSVYRSDDLTDSDCTKTATQSTPVRNWYGGSPTYYRTWSYAFVELSSECTGGVLWYHYQQRKNWLGYYIDVVSSSNWTDPGTKVYSFLARNCQNLNNTDWRGRWTETPAYTSVANLACY